MSTGFGAAPWGLFPFGLDVFPVPAAVTGNAPVAHWYDPAEHDFRLTSTGDQAEKDYIDEGMALAMGIKRGTIAGSPDTGNTIHEIQYLDAVTLQADVESRIRLAQPCARFLASGDVVISAVTASIIDGHIVATVSYHKPKLDRNATKFVTYKGD